MVYGDPGCDASSLCTSNEDKSSKFSNNVHTCMFKMLSSDYEITVRQKKYIRNQEPLFNRKIRLGFILNFSIQALASPKGLFNI